MSGELIVRNPGALSLVQDSGRYGYQRYGVSPGGVLDPEALLIGNLLVGNDPASAVIEVTFGGAEFEFIDAALVAITGGDLQPTLDGTPLSLFESFAAPAGSVLRLAGPGEGLRSYIAIAGGIETAPVLRSRATHVATALGGLNGKPLQTGDRLPPGSASPDAQPGARVAGDLSSPIDGPLEVRVIAGPQREYFTEAGVQAFLNSEYTVSETSDRQGLRLDGAVIEAVEGRYDIVSDAVAFGSIQVPGDGKPIVLLADRQTTGGYAKIAVVATVDFGLLAQAAPGTKLRFVDISVEDAQSLLRNRRERVLKQDLLVGLSARSDVLSVAGVDVDLALRYRSAELSQDSGSMASIVTGGVQTTVRIREFE